MKRRKRNKGFFKIFAGVWVVFLLAALVAVGSIDYFLYSSYQRELAGSTAETLVQEMSGYLEDLDIDALREYARNGFKGKEKLSEKEELVVQRFALTFNAMGSNGRYIVIWDEEGKELYHTGESIFLAYNEENSKQRKKAVCVEEDVVSLLKKKKKYEKKCISAYINGASFYPEKIALTNVETGEKEEITVPLEGIDLDGYQKVENLEDTFLYVAAGEDQYVPSLSGNASWEERERDNEYLSTLRKYEKHGLEQDPVLSKKMDHLMTVDGMEQYWNDEETEETEYQQTRGCTYGFHNGINEDEVVGTYYIYNESGDVFHVIVGQKFETFTYCRPVLIASWILGFFISVALALIVSGYFYRIYKKELAMQKQQRLFSSSLAHDLKTPLAAISGYTDNIMEHVQPDKEKQYLQGIQENVTCMNDLIGEVLTLAKIEHIGKIEKTRLSLHELFQQKENLYKKMLADKHLTIKRTGEAEISGDAYLTDQLVTNLLDNAIRYAIPETEIEIHCSRDEFSIANRAEKMTKEEIKEIQKPFAKGEISRTRTDKGGHGLGLSIIQEILELCGWKGKMQYVDGKIVVVVKMK